MRHLAHKQCQTNIINQRHNKDVDLNGGLNVLQINILGIHLLYRWPLQLEPQPRSH